MSTEGRHLDRLTAVDASFLTNESSNSHMHVGAILIFEGPPPKYVDLVDHVLVVDDLLAHVDGGAVDLERALDRLHGTVDAGAVAARGGEQNLPRA